MSEEKKFWQINGEKIELNDQTAEMLNAMSDPKQVKSITDELIHFSDAAKGGFANLQNQSFMKRLMGGMTGKNTQEMAHAMENYHDAIQFLGYLSTCLYLQNVQWNEQMKILQPILEAWEKGQHDEWKTLLSLQEDYRNLVHSQETQQKNIDEILTRTTILGKEYKAMEDWRSESSIHIRRIAETAEQTEKKSKKSISELRILQEEIAREMRALNEKMKTEMREFQLEADAVLSQMNSFMETQQHRSDLLFEQVNLLQSYVQMPWWRRIFSRKLKQQIAATKEKQN